MQEELADCPFYYNVGVLSHRIHTAPVPSKQFASALLNMGCRYSYTHASPDCFKTDATPAQVWDIMRAYHCAEMARVNGGGAGSGGVLAGSKKRETDVLANTILAKMSEGSTTEMASMVDFTLHPDCELPSKKLKLRRFQHNPPNWGPMKKASANTDNNSNNGTSNASKEAEKKNQKMNKK